MYKNKIGVVDIKGGFGNQLFQISFAKYLIDNDINIYLNTRNFERSKNIKNLQVDLRELILPVNVFEMEEISNVKFKIIETIQNISKDKMVKKFTDNNFEIDELSKVNRFDGYWQKSDYFYHSKNFLVSSLKKNKIIESGLKSDKIKGSTMLHIRRGDYLKMGETLSTNYYKQALEIANKNIKNFSFSVFTDDEGWVKENTLFNDAENVFYSTNSKDDTLSTFSQMLNYENFIVANSTFSLLAALLAQTESTFVLIPDPWFRKSNKKMQFKSTIKISNEIE